jgi:uncharacterized protein (AIM24 family)
MDTQQFKTQHAPEESADRFELENPYTLDVDVEGSLMAKAGSMIAHTGNLSFTGKSSAEGGITGFVKEAVSSEGTPKVTRKKRSSVD